MFMKARRDIVDNLKDGDRFSLDSGKTWHVCAVVLFGDIAVYVNDRRDDDAPTTRIDGERTAAVLIA